MIGAMTERLTLQREVYTPDGIGGQTKTWTTVGTVWAQVMPVRGAEPMIEGRVAATETVKFRMWAREDMTETTRILHRGVPWNVRNVVTASGRNGLIDVVAERGVAM